MPFAKKSVQYPIPISVLQLSPRYSCCIVILKVPSWEQKYESHKVKSLGCKAGVIPHFPLKFFRSPHVCFAACVERLQNLPQLIRSLTQARQHMYFRSQTRSTTS
ncbi:hypothetical protein NPIL_699131 [Nephila pilipes]|uniref:Uncharacterized protein n=1 Tax=Nephila pilipes TaxID=299642 RepID=A0A8X6TF60_NEPPI|nr:hypothetical protein NPIL_699131 [Nephila pilipes]